MDVVSPRIVIVAGRPYRDLGGALTTKSQPAQQWEDEEQGEEEPHAREEPDAAGPDAEAQPQEEEEDLDEELEMRQVCLRTNK